jgi:hypothetical protein
MMKKALLLAVFTFVFVAGWISFAQADLEWKILKELDLKSTPLDMAPSPDGKWLWILTPGEVLIFSVREGILTDRIPVDKEFDRIAALPRPELFTITSSTKKALQVIFFEPFYKIDVSELPAKGPYDASVALVVFDDYQ